MSQQRQNSCLANAIIFDSDLVKLLNTRDVRIPTNFIGVRRVRPHKLLLEEKKNKIPSHNSVPTFTVKLANGTVRRMTTKEKKIEKQKLKLQRKEDRKRQRQEQIYCASLNESTVQAFDFDSSTLGQDKAPSTGMHPRNPSWCIWEMTGSIAEACANIKTLRRPWDCQ